MNSGAQDAAQTGNLSLECSHPFTFKRTTPGDGEIAQTYTCYWKASLGDFKRSKKERHARKQVQKNNRYKKEIQNSAPTYVDPISNPFGRVTDVSSGQPPPTRRPYPTPQKVGIPTCHQSTRCSSPTHSLCIWPCPLGDCISARLVD